LLLFLKDRQNKENDSRLKILEKSNIEKIKKRKKAKHPEQRCYLLRHNMDPCCSIVKGAVY